MCTLYTQLAVCTREMHIYNTLYLCALNPLCTRHGIDVIVPVSHQFINKLLHIILCVKRCCHRFSIHAQQHVVNKHTHTPMRDSLEWMIVFVFALNKLLRFV